MPNIDKWVGVRGGFKKEKNVKFPPHQSHSGLSAQGYQFKPFLEHVFFPFSNGKSINFSFLKAPLNAHYLF